MHCILPPDHEGPCVLADPVALHAENKRLRAALEEIASIPEQFGIGRWIDIAEAALKKPLG